LANTSHENPCLPNKKILHSTGGANYRAPQDKGNKAASRLKVIEEAIFEEEEAAEQGYQIFSSYSKEVFPHQQNYSGKSINLIRSLLTESSVLLNILILFF